LHTDHFDLGEEKKTQKELKEHILHEAYEQLFASFDEQHGGFGHAPKFPTPHNLMFF